MVSTLENLGYKYQIVVATDDGLFLYGQQLIGDGYDEYDSPFDLYVFEGTVGENIYTIDQNVVNGSEFVLENGAIDWEGLVDYAYADRLLKGLEVFVTQWNNLNAYGTDETDKFVDEMMHIGLL